jgi:hypothetical protein
MPGVWRSKALSSSAGAWGWSSWSPRLLAAAAHPAYLDCGRGTPQPSRPADEAAFAAGGLGTGPHQPTMPADAAERRQLRIGTIEVLQALMPSGPLPTQCAYFARDVGRIDP